MVVKRAFSLEAGLLGADRQAECTDILAGENGLRRCFCFYTATIPADRRENQSTSTSLKLSVMNKVFEQTGELTAVDVINDAHVANVVLFVDKKRI